ncbi:hypothetical protein LVY72_10960 [Arthrobacter sp. I2-34]|uniref:Uncharacterized protein n=1 Tax=Arthrobacter hankyongi TaxID=2904801 RepID=A0ABS9L7G3_9MICC|nr:hypothetical protein [Arthrobacter hankyongi]MCG2622432.1 hypothetical protein [Arthrobacter hankyongi]
MDTLAGILPGGYWDGEGRLHRSFELAALTGRDEELLAQASDRPPAALVTELLARVLKSLGSICPVPEQVARQLLVGDRQFLLLRLRQATFGDSVRAGLVCPWADCGRPVTVEFSLTDLPVSEPGDKGPVYRLTLSAAAAPDSGDVGRTVSFRLPTGADQEELSPWLAVNEARALTLLLERCIREVGGSAPPGRELVGALSPLARAEIEERMQQLAPGIEEMIEAGCAECGRSFLVPFDVQRFFFGELRADSGLLYREVHYLAYHYHWGEQEIMAMTRGRRRTYLEVLADEIERLNDGA